MPCEVEDLDVRKVVRVGSDPLVIVVPRRVSHGADQIDETTFVVHGPELLPRSTEGLVDAA